MQSHTLQLQQCMPFMHGLLQVRGRRICCPFTSRQMDIEDDDGELDVDDE